MIQIDSFLSFRTSRRLAYVWGGMNTKLAIIAVFLACVGAASVFADQNSPE